MVTRDTEYQRRYKTKRRQRAAAYLGGRCVVCGTDQSLEFDHVDPATRVSTISDAIGRCWSWDRLRVELDKCQLLCKAHHLEKSRAEGSLSVTWNRVDNPACGTGAAYTRLRCRCGPCREWKRLYRAGEVNHAGEVQGTMLHS
jgi:hypothetical protein